MKLGHIRVYLSFFLSLTGPLLFSQESYSIKVHFIYGSKPKKEFRATEGKWFGGIWGGHVGIETDSNQILNFGPQGKFHWFSKSANRHSHFVIHTRENFWSIFKRTEGPVKRLSIEIPITKEQKHRLDSIRSAYLANTPYDYAFVGMRCAASAYDVLGLIHIMKPYSHARTYLKIRYPAKLRKRLLKKAKKNNWIIIREVGTKKRKWERG
ncbi:MAG: hypothetical protein ACHQRM_06640 [Bacteroidia bacterium]